MLFRTFSLEYDVANYRLCPLVIFCLHGCKYGVAAISYISKMLEWLVSEQLNNHPNVITTLPVHVWR